MNVCTGMFYLHFTKNKFKKSWRCYTICDKKKCEIPNHYFLVLLILARKETKNH